MTVTSVTTVIFNQTGGGMWSQKNHLVRAAGVFHRCAATRVASPPTVGTAKCHLSACDTHTHTHTHTPITRTAPKTADLKHTNTSNPQLEPTLEALG